MRGNHIHAGDVPDETCDFIVIDKGDFDYKEKPNQLKESGSYGEELRENPESLMQENERKTMGTDLGS